MLIYLFSWNNFSGAYYQFSRQYIVFRRKLFIIFDLMLRFNQ
jgi:hypothetical protein